MGGTLRLTGDADRAAGQGSARRLRLPCRHGRGRRRAGRALYERSPSGRGQHVDVSVQEVAFSRNVNGVLVWQFDRRKLQRAAAR